MKIVHCLNHYLPDNIGGCEVYTHALAKAQQKHGHEVAIILPFVTKQRKEAFRNSYEYDGVMVYFFEETTNPEDKAVHYGKKEPAGVRSFVKLTETLQPDVIHFQQLNKSMGFTAAHIRAVQHLKAKKIFTSHLSSPTCNSGLMLYRNKPCSGLIRNFNCTNCVYQSVYNIRPGISELVTSMSLLAENTGLAAALPNGKLKSIFSIAGWAKRTKRELKIIYENVDAIAVVSKWYREVLLLNGVPANKIEYVPQTPVVSFDKTTAAHTSASPLPIQIVFVGRVQHQKGIHLLLEAVSRFSQDKVQLYIYGKKLTDDYYRQCVAQSSGLKNVYWMNELSPAEVIPTLKQHHIFCLPSTTSEMSPLVIQEAFAAGIPVLASNNAGNREQVQHNVNGLLFDFNNQQSLTNNIQRLIEEDTLYQQLTGNVKSPGNFDDTCDHYMRLYA